MSGGEKKARKAYACILNFFRALDSVTRATGDLLFVGMTDLVAILGAHSLGVPEATKVKPKIFLAWIDPTLPARPDAVQPREQKMLEWLQPERLVEEDDPKAPVSEDETGGIDTNNTEKDCTDEESSSVGLPQCRYCSTEEDTIRHRYW